MQLSEANLKVKIKGHPKTMRGHTSPRIHPTMSNSSIFHMIEIVIVANIQVVWVMNGVSFLCLWNKNYMRITISDIPSDIIEEVIIGKIEKLDIV